MNVTLNAIYSKLALEHQPLTRVVSIESETIHNVYRRVYHHRATRL